MVINITFLLSKKISVCYNAFIKYEKEYLNKIDQMKNYFIEDYDKTIDDISAKVGDINSFNNKEDLSSYMTALNDLKTTIQIEYENYNVIDEEKFNMYSDILIQIVDQVVIAILVKVAILHLVVAVVKLDHQVLHLIMIIMCYDRRFSVMQEILARFLCIF